MSGRTQVAKVFRDISKDYLNRFMNTYLLRVLELFLKYLMETLHTHHGDASHRRGAWERYCGHILSMYMGLKMIDIKTTRDLPLPDFFCHHIPIPFSPLFSKLKFTFPSSDTSTHRFFLLMEKAA
jgi:hypothetical protein